MTFVQRLLSLGFIPMLVLLAFQHFSPETFASFQDAVQPYVSRTPLSHFLAESLPARSETPIFITSTTHWSHVEKIAAIAVELAQLGYPITFITGRVYQEYISKLHPNIEFAAFLGPDDKMTQEDIEYWLSLPSGEEQELFIMKKVLADGMPDQHETVQLQLRQFQEKYGDEKPMIVMFDQSVMGHHPIMFGAPGLKPHSNIGICMAPLALDSNDTFPFRSGKVPHIGPDAKAVHWVAYQERNKDRFHTELDEYWWAKLREMGAVQDFYPTILHAMNTKPDHLLAFGIPEFEFPRSDAETDIRYFGSFKNIGKKADQNSKAPDLPEWWSDIAKAKKDGKKIIAVSQGTVELNLEEIVLPTIKALKDRDDILLIASTVAVEPEEVPNLIVPKNTRVAKFVPYDQLLALVDLLVSNGGYGAVQHALRLGIPMVVSGLGQDKATTNSIVHWSGVGINLGERSPSVDQIGLAVKEVLANEKYAQKAKTLSKEFEKYDLAKVFDTVVQDVVRDWKRTKFTTARKL